MQVWLVDDERSILESLSIRLSSDEYEVKTFDSLASCEREISSIDNTVIFVLDHDFSNSEIAHLQNGYDLAQVIKSACWTKGVTPIIYLTGRESRENFDNARSELGGLAPDYFISKSQLSSDLLETTIRFYIDRYFNFEVAIEDFGLERAIEIFTDPLPR